MGARIVAVVESGLLAAAVSGWLWAPTPTWENELLGVGRFEFRQKVTCDFLGALILGRPAGLQCWFGGIKEVVHFGICGAPL